MIGAQMRLLTLYFMLPAVIAGGFAAIYAFMVLFYIFIAPSVT